MLLRTNRRTQIQLKEGKSCLLWTGQLKLILLLRFLQRQTTPSNDGSNDRPKAILAFPAVPSKNPSPSPSPRPSTQKSIESSERSESADTVSSGASAVSPPVSPSGLWPTCDIQESQQEDEYDADGMEESIRQEAALRRRASSMDFDTEQTFEAMPGFLTPGKIVWIHTCVSRSIKTYFKVKARAARRLNYVILHERINNLL